MNAPSGPAPHEKPVYSSVPDQQIQGAGRERKRPQLYDFSEADISPTSLQTSSTSSKSKKRKTKKQASKTTLTTGESVVELIQNAEQNRILSPPQPDIQIGYVSPPDLRTRYHGYEQERGVSVWDAGNET